MVTNMQLSLEKICKDFAEGLFAADAKKPICMGRKRAYQAGIGPLGEDQAVELILAEMKYANPNFYSTAGQHLPYPESRQKADLWFGDPLEWVMEVKMARFWGDNGKPDDTAIKDLLSPYPKHRSAVTDCSKLGASRFACRTGIIIYGFEYDDMPLEPAISSWEILAKQLVRIGDRITCPVSKTLVHPVHREACVFGWEIRPKDQSGS